MEDMQIFNRLEGMLAKAASVNLARAPVSVVIYNFQVSRKFVLLYSSVCSFFLIISMAIMYVLCRSFQQICT